MKTCLERIKGHNDCNLTCPMKVLVSKESLVLIRGEVHTKVSIYALATLFPYLFVSKCVVIVSGCVKQVLRVFLPGSHKDL